MRVVLVFLFSIILAGCGQSNKDRVENFRLCNEAGMRPADIMGSIVCMP